LGNIGIEQMTARKKLMAKNKSYVLSVAAVFATIVLYDFVVHQNFLMDMYQRTEDVWRPIDDMNMISMFASQLFFAVMFVFIFSRNYENRGVQEGVRFGMYIGLLLAALNLGTYSYLPIPFGLTLCWMLAALVKGLVCGIAVSSIYKK
jgi:hypothetical protein